jgi:hypothetical protein
VSDERAEFADIFLGGVADLPATLTAEILGRTFAAAPVPYTSGLLPGEPETAETDDEDVTGWTFHPEPIHPDVAADPGDVHHDHDDDWDLDGDW